MVTTAPMERLDWLLDDLVRRLVGVRHAVVLSADGLLLGQSTAIERDAAEHLCAMASALHGLARSVGRRFDGGSVRQTVVELDRSVLFVSSAGSNACLALLAEESADLGLIAYEIGQVVIRVGTVLSASTRGSRAGRPDSGVP